MTRAEREQGTAGHENTDADLALVARVVSRSGRGVSADDNQVPQYETRQMAETTGSFAVRYPVVFQDADQARVTGALEVVDGRVLLTGRSRGGLVELDFPSAELSEVRIGRAAGERLNGYATIVLVRRNEAPVLVAPFGSVLLHEIADLLAALSAEPIEVADELDLVVPIRPDAQQRVRELIAQGPPFDPAALKLRRHQVLLGPEDVIFAFEGPQIRETLERTLAKPSLWKAGVAWRRCIAGPPCISSPADRTTTRHELIYSWPPHPGTAATSAPR
jgi:hypothetical protein